MSEFPPRSIDAFLRSCAGEWLTVRSRFQLQPQAPAAAGSGDAAATPEPHAAGGSDPEPGPYPVDPAAEADRHEERWHEADKGALLVTYLEPASGDEPGGLEVTPPPAEGRSLPPVQVHFSAAGIFRSQGVAGEPLGDGRWQLWPDGSLELTSRGEHAVVRERIWFTKPNLRLRSSVERRHDGQPGRASFSSEIRRVARAAASAP